MANEQRRYEQVDNLRTEETVEQFRQSKRAPYGAKYDQGFRYSRHGLPKMFFASTDEALEYLRGKK